MFGMLAPRIAELSRPDYDHALLEYARLEFPHESPAYIRSQALASDRGPQTPRPHRFWGFLRFRASGPQRAPEPETA
ncbi:MAG: hypothetical protein L3K14_03885 [Thermoplasmata archaeon]|nr:hypothetical protein [Thermoplasmata archaeon]